MIQSILCKVKMVWNRNLSLGNKISYLKMESLLGIFLHLTREPSINDGFNFSRYYDLTPKSLPFLYNYSSIIFLHFGPLLHNMVWYFVTKLFWPTVRKIVLVNEKNFWSFLRLKAENLQKFWDYSNNLFKQWKVRPIFGNKMFF